VPSALIQSLNPLIGDFINTIDPSARGIHSLARFHGGRGRSGNPRSSRLRPRAARLAHVMPDRPYSEFHTPSLFGLLISTGAGRGLMSPSILRRTSTLSLGLLLDKMSIASCGIPKCL
jgi:hypothetical protein